MDGRDSGVAGSGGIREEEQTSISKHTYARISTNYQQFITNVCNMLYLMLFILHL